MGFSDIHLLRVNLDEKNVINEKLDYNYYKGYIGGWGVGVKLAWEEIKPDISALDPANPVIICAGIAAGTIVPASSRTAIITKYPITGAVAMGNGGLNFADALRHTGYHIIDITGASKEGPVYLEITEKGAFIRDASDLWGLDIYETTEELWGRYGNRASVIAIGQAGENECNLSFALIDNCGSVGKGGLGAVLGSKKLKAIVAVGEQPVAVADLEKFNKALKEVDQRVANFPNADVYIEKGTYWKWDHWFEDGFATENWSKLYSKELATEQFGPEIYLGKAKLARAACITCPLPDKEILCVREGEYKGLVTYAGGFAGRATNLFTRCGITSYDQVLKLVDILNRTGVCCHGITSLIDFAVSLYDDGIINIEDTGGVALRRDFETTLKLIEDTVAKRGFGEVLSEGYPGFYKRYGEHLKDYAVENKGLDMLYEPRLNRFGTKPFIMMVNPRGGHHQPGVSPTDALGATVESFKDFCQRAGVPEDAQERIFNNDMKLHVGRLSKYTQEFYTVLSALGICSKMPMGNMFSMEDCADLIASIQGVEYDAETLKTDAERVWNLYRRINGREGFTEKDDTFPKKWLTPLKGEKKDAPIMDYFETKILTETDILKIREDYYIECGWDPKTGMPTKEKLIELGLK